MDSNLGFVLKVILLSALLSVLIKAGDSYWVLQPTQSIVLIAVFLPTLLVAIALGWRAWQDHQQP